MRATLHSANRLWKSQVGKGGDLRGLALVLALAALAAREAHLLGLLLLALLLPAGRFAFFADFFFANLYVGKCTSYASLTTGADFFLAFFFFFFFFALGFFAFFAFFAGFLAAFFAYTYFGLSKTVCYPLDCGTLG